jgi:hypothetical protein
MPLKNREARLAYNRAYKAKLREDPAYRRAESVAYVAWTRTPRGREKHKADAALYRKRYPEKSAARNAVNNAILAGKMQRGRCEVCGQLGQAHHADYSKPLEVRWLCKLHHEEVEHADK